MLIDLLIAILVLAGGLFALIGSWGLVRLPSLMTRLHAPTKAVTLGVGCSLIASMVYSIAKLGVWSFHELLITLFLFIAAPIGPYLISKAYLFRQFNRYDSCQMDNIPEGVPPAGPNAGPDTGWSTLGKAEETTR